MSPKSLFCCTIALLLTGASARAQSLGNDCGLPNPHPIDQAIDSAIDGVGHIFDGKWLGSSSGAACCNPKNRVWGSAEYMLVWLNGTQTPPLITSSPNGVPQGTAAVLGQPTTNVLYGGNSIDANPYSAMRFSVGSWLSCNADFGVEVGGFFLFNRATSFSASGTGASDSVAVARPFIDATTGKESAAYSAFANKLAGSSSASLDTSFWGTDVNLVARDHLGCVLPFTVLAGIRYLDLDQNLSMQDLSTPQGTSSIPFAGLVTVTNPNQVRITDSYQTRNQFIGGQLGLRTNIELSKFDLGLGAKITIGATHQTLTINGTSEALASNGQMLLLTPGGLLANASNMGVYSRDAFSFVPELELKLSYRLTNNLSAFVGYNFLYWSQVAQPGEQISRVVNLTKVPTSGVFNSAPGTVGTASISSSNFTMNSISVGACLKF